MSRHLLLAIALGAGALAAYAHAPIARSAKPGTPAKAVTRTAPAPLRLHETSLPSVVKPLQTPARAAAQPYSLPFSMGPTLQQMVDEFIVLDANGDADGGYNCWTYSEYFDSPLYWANPSRTQADDYLVFPAIKIDDPSKVYQVSIQARGTTTDDGSFESFEIVMGKQPTAASLSQVLLQAPVVTFNKGEMATFSQPFAVKEAGVYYFAVRCTSYSGWRLLVKNLEIKATEAKATIPASASDLTLTPDSRGELQATASFLFPTFDISGTPLPAGQSLTATLTSSAGTATASGTPGASGSAIVPMPEGVGSVTLTVANADGQGLPVTASTRCGLDIPVAPQVTTSVSEDNMTLTLTWPPVDKGMNGGIVLPEGVRYDVFRHDEESDQWYRVAQDLAECTYSVTAAKGTPLEYYDMAVSAHNAKGENDESPYVTELIGTPYSLPVNETLEGSQLHYVGLTVDQPSDEYTALFGSGDPSLVDPYFANAKGAALMGMCGEYGTARGHITLPKVSTQGETDVQIVLPLFTGRYTPAIDVYAQLNGQQPVKIGSVDRSLPDGWRDVPFNLPAQFCGKPCVSISLDFFFENSAQYFLLEGYKIKRGSPSDMAVTAISFNPDPIVPGEPCTVTVNVTNQGMYEVAMPSLSGRISLAGKSIGNVALTPQEQGPVAPQTTVTFTGEIMLNSADHIDKYINFTAELATADDTPDNDTLTVQAKTTGVQHPVITDLTANFLDEPGHIALCWTNPVPGEETETCEFLPPFSFDSRLGPWLNYDFDGGDPYTLGDVEGIYIPEDTKPKAFQVVSTLSSGLQQTVGIAGYDASDNVLMAFCPQGRMADDWLISPEIKGGSEVNFMFDIVSEEYPETIEVFISTTDRDIDSFTTKAGTYTKRTAGWEELRCTLPAGAKYFALHYCSNDCFGIILDDIIYSPSTPTFDLKAVKVIRNDQLLATLTPADESYLDTTPERDARYTYHVQPVYTHADGEKQGLRSNAATLTANSLSEIEATGLRLIPGKGILTIERTFRTPLTIANAQGQTIATLAAATGTTTLHLPAGIYICAGQKLLVK